MLESHLLLFHAVEIVLLGAEWDVLLLAEVLSAWHLDIHIHFVGISEGRRHWKLQCFLKTLTFLSLFQTTRW